MRHMSPSLRRTMTGNGLKVGSVAGSRPRLALGAVLALAAWTLATFHDQFWWAPDDGAYAHIAERLLAGEILHRDIQDLHAGYINVVNAFALRLFGSDLVAMRYPLAALTLVQTYLIFRLLLPSGISVAIAGGAGMAILTSVQFLNPTAHWYSLFVTVTILTVLVRMRQESRWRLFVIGFLLMTLFLFRQLTGVMVAIGVVTYLLCENETLNRDQGRGRRLILARITLTLMGFGLAAYLGVKTDVGAILFFGLGPLAIIVWATAHGGRDNRDTAILLMKVLAGGLVALVPLTMYHLVNGSIAAWLYDAFVAAVNLTDLSFFERARYTNILLIALPSIAVPQSVAGVLNGLFWIALLMLAIATAVLMLRMLRRDGLRDGARRYALPFMATFHALVAVHYQIPIYLLYTVGLSLAGLLWLGAAHSAAARHGTVALAALVCGIGLCFQAGQPLDRGLVGIVTGQRADAPVDTGLAKASLRIGANEAATYRDIVALIERETPADAAILAIPFNPELYVLSGRRNPTRFFNVAMGVPTDRALDELLETLRNDPPRLVFFRPDDKYNTSRTARIMDIVRTRYDALPSHGSFEIYRYRSNGEKGR